MAVKEGGEQVRHVVGVKKEMSKLQSNLRAIQAVLVDAEQRQVTEEAGRLWLEQLKYVAYDMEDVLDEWNTAWLKLQIGGFDDNKSAVVCSCLPTSFFGVQHVFIRRDIALKVKDINERLNDIAKQKDMFNLNVNLIKGILEKLEQVGTISSIDVSEISGRDMEKNYLISKSVADSSAEQSSLHITSLVGVGGIGKTTLDQLAYNDDEVKRNFKQKIWVCVSDPFDEFKIARAIIEALKGSTTNLQEFQSLTQYIKDPVGEKKFFLVLDEVWNENYNKFEKLYNCLKNGRQGSKILITTRKEIVAHTMRSNDIIPIKELSEEGCCSLFKQLAFSGRSSKEYKKLEKMVKKLYVSAKVYL